MYSEFRRTKHPPVPNCSLALGYRVIEETSPIFVWWTSQGHEIAASETTPAALGYHTTLLVGHLVIDVIGLAEPHRLITEHEEGLHVLWPTAVIPNATFTWPPSRRFKGVEDEKLV